MKPTKSYLQFVSDLKQTIVQSRYLAARLANREQLLLYFKAGKALSEKITNEKWGNSVLETISEDLQMQMPGLKGFSARNLRKIRQFFEAHQESVVWQSPTAKLPGDSIRPSLTAKFEGFLGISFTHHILILNKSSNVEEQSFYITLAAREFWSVSVLEHKIDSRLFEKQGSLPNNFSAVLPDDLRPSAIQIFNDEYLMDYMNLGEHDDEREFESKIVVNIRDFILRMGKGFSFMGNQFRVELDGDEFFIDLLFFNRYLRCLVVFELKKGKFKPEYAGKLNFYLNILNEKVKLKDENNSIGIVLCKEKNDTVVEYSVKSLASPMGVATYKTTREMPNKIKEVLPNTMELGKLL